MKDLRPLGGNFRPSAHRIRTAAESTDSKKSQSVDKRTLTRWAWRGPCILDSSKQARVAGTGFFGATSSGRRGPLWSHRLKWSWSALPDSVSLCRSQCCTAFQDNVQLAYRILAVQIRVLHELSSWYSFGHQRTESIRSFSGNRLDRSMIRSSACFLGLSIMRSLGRKDYMAFIEPIPFVSCPNHHPFGSGKSSPRSVPCPVNVRTFRCLKLESFARDLNRICYLL